MVSYGYHRKLKGTKNEFNKYLNKNKISFVFKNISPHPPKLKKTLK
jgi:hypothetical protein